MLLYGLGIGLLILLGLIGYGARFYTDWLWFSSVGYQGPFLKILLTKWGLRLGAALFFFGFLWGNLLVTRKYLLKALQPKLRETVLEADTWPQGISLSLRKGVGFRLI